MAITASYGFAGSINESQWSTLHEPVNPGHVDGMTATVGSGTREIDIASGTAWAVGTYHVASATTVALSANSSGNTRIDTIVVNINFSTDTATVTAVEGTPAASPVAPTLTQTAGTQWQIPLCHVTVVDGETAFSTADIEDARPLAVTSQELEITDKTDVARGWVPWHWGAPRTWAFSSGSLPVTFGATTPDGWEWAEVPSVDIRTRSNAYPDYFYWFAVGNETVTGCDVHTLRSDGTQITGSLAVWFTLTGYIVRT